MPLKKPCAVPAQKPDRHSPEPLSCPIWIVAPLVPDNEQEAYRLRAETNITKIMKILELAELTASGMENISGDIVIQRAC